MKDKRKLWTNHWIKYSLLMFVCVVLMIFGFQAYHLNWIDGIQLGYAGSIIGGGLTLLGVWLTIDSQKQQIMEQNERLDKQRKEDLAIQYRPMIDIKIKEDDIYKTFSENDTYIAIELLCKNIGRAELLDLKASIYYRDVDSDVFKLLNNEYTFTTALPVGETQSLSIGVYLEETNTKKMIDIGDVCAIVTYYDIFDNLLTHFIHILYNFDENGKMFIVIAEDFYYSDIKEAQLFDINKF